MVKWSKRHLYLGPFCYIDRQSSQGKDRTVCSVVICLSHAHICFLISMHTSLQRRSRYAGTLPGVLGPLASNVNLYEWIIYLKCTKYYKRKSMVHIYMYILVTLTEIWQSHWWKHDTCMPDKDMSVSYSFIIYTPLSSQMFSFELT